MGKRALDARREALGKNIAEGLDTSMSYRAQVIPLPQKNKDGGPATIDAEARSVEMVGATEAAVNEIDWDQWEMIPTILRMDGCQMPANGQLPLLDSHQRRTTATVIGSFRDCRIENNQFVGRAVFSTAPEAEGPWLKMTEGHLTDCSIARLDNEATYIPEGQTGVIGGRSYDGPVKVVTNWTPKEMSICPIGADDMAKARSASAIVSNKRGEETMNERLRKYLESRGLSAEATEDQAWAFVETLEVRTLAGDGSAVTKPAQPPVEEQVRAAVIAEQDRIEEIRAIGSHASLTDDEIRLAIRDRHSVEQVRKAAFEKVIATDYQNPGFRGSIEVGADSRDKFRTAAEHGLLLRAGITIEKPAPGAVDLRGFSLREMAREALRVAGLPTGGDALIMVGRALTSSDLPILLGNVAHLSMMDGWATADETWPVWCSTGTVSDFKIHTMARAGETDDLDEIPEEAEYKYGKISEQKEQYKVVTYGKLFAISRQAIINDELGALTDIPRKHGESAARKVGDLPYAVLVANAAMGDGVTLFHSNHGNIGSTAVIGTASIAEAITKMKLQKDIGGKRRLNIRPQFVIAPVTTEGAAEIFFNSGAFADGSGSNSTGALAATRVNPYAGARFTRVYEPRLDDADTKKFYIAGPKGKTVTVFFLNGNQGPYLETKQGWSVDGVEMKVRIDAGAKAVDWKGLISNAGG